VDNSRITQSATGEAPAATGRRRRRSVLWISFLGAGLLLSTVWATGFGTSQSDTSNGTNAASVVVDGTPHTLDYYHSPYEGLVSSPEQLQVGWNGYWGTVLADTSMFKIDMSGATVDGAGTYYIEVMVKNPIGQNWDAQQYRITLFTDTVCDGTEAVPTSGASFKGDRLLNVTTQDSYVSFQGLTKNTTGEVYCVGVHNINPAQDDQGTFLRRPNLAAFPTATLFTALVNRSS